MTSFPIDIPFHLFASCILVKGHKRSCIYDLQREDFEYIPNALHEILEEHKDISFTKLLNSFEFNEDKETLFDYFNFLYNKEFIFFSNLKSSSFPKYQIEFSKPYNVSTMIVDIDSFEMNFINILLNNIFKVKVECLVLRFINTTYDTIIAVLKEFNNMPTRIIQVLIDKKTTIEKHLVESVFKINDRVSLIVSASEEEYSDQFAGGIFFSTKKDIINVKNEITDISDFTPNLDLYMESRLYNAFYNRRVYIDLNGCILRYEGDEMIFGNISDMDLSEILLIPDFRNYWHVKKDDIQVCRDCEYKYMCVDNRLPVKTNDLFWEFEKECNYNPYNSKWKK